MGLKPYIPKWQQLFHTWNENWNNNKFPTKLLFLLLLLLLYHKTPPLAFQESNKSRKSNKVLIKNEFISHSHYTQSPIATSSELSIGLMPYNMGYDECFYCMKIKYVNKHCEHHYCKKCKPVGQCLECPSYPIRSSRISPISRISKFLGIRNKHQ
jgi:hypothetical protein